MAAVKTKTMKVVFSLALLLLPLASAAEVKFDFMYFVQQWAPSYCATPPHECQYKPRPPPNDFTIHGLWPRYGNGTGRPEYCNSSDPLDPKQIEDLEKPLNQTWRSLLLNHTNLELWSHEWSRHGTCSNLGQHGYFSAALALERLTNLTGILADGGVVPSDVKTYTFRDISDALAKGTGFRTYLQCSQDKITGETLLYQVLQCVDRSGEGFVNCTAPLENHCANADKIKMPIWFYDQ